ncbi:uncharacterized protein Z518_04702 [Rhinocladiella mackenziei CBS 650.93]|uniref:Nephrocystin 3-like N-terminal domain-containing protein n=1 Tax=Rhinocladiella mackenziei CBS 650.93 TaxID=1442369 RepID=A0A0D2IU87_9EURO|nr:uncharacterized protein Z518_04702 [Rhinocladiella mackenziei CBS 650.93]KIX06726.1 hypothetical protein Z518_04702 [Rhinocladiella mackenziei CBS 650.93]
MALIGKRRNWRRAPVFESFPSGIKVLFDPPEATLDVVFVHGLTGDRERTWTSPTPEVLTFGYDAYVVRKHGEVAQIDISHHAKDLLNTLVNERQDHASATRPIIFVAHSLGGVLCKDALRASEVSGDMHLESITSCTWGIAFIGTPHGGSWLATWAKLPVTILDILKRTDVTLLSLLKPNSEVLARIHDDFLSMIRRRGSDHRQIEIACFYETMPLLGRVQIVDQPSATIPGFNNISIHADHRDVARFASADHPGCKSIIGVLGRWARRGAADGGLNADAEAFLETLSFSEMGVRQAIIERAESGTCNWILQNPAYKAWANCEDLDKSHGLLWVKGKPGSGKSTLMKHIASKTPKPKGTVRLVFFFNARGTEQERNAEGLFKTFLHQLINESLFMRNRLLTLFRKKRAMAGKRGIIWSSAELRNIFFDTVQFNSRAPVEIFIDALDECNDEEVRAIIAAFETCAAVYMAKGSRNLKICWSSRYYPYISIVHGFEIKVDNMNLEDIALYVSRHLARSRRRESLRCLEPIIVKKSKGVFLWGVLVVNKICKLADKGLPIARIQKVIHDLPDELSTLYSDIFATLDPELAEDTASLMYLVLYATRPLDTDELRLGIEFMRQCYPAALHDFACLTEQVSYFQLFITELSGGLLEVVDSGVPVGRRPQSSADLEVMLGVKDYAHDTLPEEKNPQVPTQEDSDVETRWIVHVIHETVRDFMMADGVCHLPGRSSPLAMDSSMGHFRLYQMCSRIITTDELSCVITERQCNDLFTSTPDLVTKGSQWLGTTIAKYVLENICFHLVNSGFWDPAYLRQYRKPLPPDLSNEFRTEHLTQVLLRWHCIRVASQRPAGRRHAILGNGLEFNFDTVRFAQPVMESMNLSWNQFDACASDAHMCLWTLRMHFACTGYHTLQAAVAAVAHHGSDSTLAEFLQFHNRRRAHQRLGPLEISRLGVTPLQMAVDSGRPPVVKMLLEHGVLINPSGSIWGKTPLGVAVERGMSSIVFELVKHGANVNLPSNFRLPLISAASQGYSDIVQMMLDHGADVHAKSDEGQNAYEVALQAGHVKIAEMLKDLVAEDEDQNTKSTIDLATAPVHYEQSQAEHPTETGAFQPFKTPQSQEICAESSSAQQLETHMLMQGED